MLTLGKWLLYSFQGKPESRANVFRTSNSYCLLMGFDEVFNYSKT